MLTVIKSRDKSILIGVADANYTVFGRDADGKAVLKAIYAGQSVVEAYADVSFAKALKQGEHDSPPKGYPKDKNEYAVPETYSFPIDRKRIHAAISYFPKHDWGETGHKRSAAKRIMAAALKFGVDVDKDSDVARAARGD